MERSVFLQAIVVGCGLLQFGLHMAELNALIPFMDCSNNPKNCLPGMGEHYAVASSIYAIGGCFGSAIAGPLANRIGRKQAMKIIGFGFIIGSFVLATATTIVVFSIGRLLVGLFAGLAIVIGPMFIGEFSQSSNRQFLGMLSQCSVNVGILVTQTAGYLLAKHHWRIVLSLGGLVGLAQALGAQYIQESPFWLHQHGRFQEESQAAAILGLHGQTSSDLPGAGEQKFVSISRFISGKQYRTLFSLVVGIFALQQFSGINAIVFYGVNILETALPSDKAALVNIFITAMNLAVTSCAAFWISRCGHKRLIVASCWGMALFTAWMSTALDHRKTTQAIIAMMLDVSMFAVGLGPVPFMVISEVAPAEAVGAAQSVATVSNWLATFAIGALFPRFHELLGEKVFYAFSLCAVVGGLSLEYIL